MRLEDDQNKLSVFNNNGFIIENIFCFANHPATRAHFIISIIRNLYNQNALSFSIKHIMKKYIIWFMYVYLEKRQGLRARTMVLLLLITLSTPTQPFLQTRQQRKTSEISSILFNSTEVFCSQHFVSHLTFWKSIHWLSPPPPLPPPPPPAPAPHPLPHASLAVNFCDRGEGPLSKRQQRDRSQFCNETDTKNRVNKESTYIKQIAFISLCPFPETIFLHTLLKNLTN